MINKIKTYVTNILEANRKAMISEIDNIANYTEDVIATANKANEAYASQVKDLDKFLNTLNVRNMNEWERKELFLELVQIDIEESLKISGHEIKPISQQSENEASQWTLKDLACCFIDTDYAEGLARYTSHVINQQKDILNDISKHYRVEYNSWFGHQDVVIKALNKTQARKIFVGEHNSDCKVIKITEVK